MMRLYRGLKYRFLEAGKSAYWRLYYFLQDSSYMPFRREINERMLRHYAKGMARHPAIELIKKVKEISMLHEEVLLILYFLAAVSRGRILEIGTYIGGSTVIMALAAQRHRRAPIISVEPGGVLNHPSIPSADIFGDLTRNIERFRCRSHVRLHHGFSNNPAIMDAVVDEVGDAELSVLAIDADGQVQRDVENYRKLLIDGTLLVFDDYSAPGAPEKELMVKAWVDQAVGRGEVESYGLWGWGTWIGVYRGPQQVRKDATL